MISSSRKLFGAALLAIVATTPFAFGDSVTLITNSSSPQAPDQNGIGGEFTVLLDNGSPSSFAPAAYSSNALYTFPTGSPIGGLTGFETFCVQYDTHFQPGPNNAYNYSISSTIMPGSAPLTIGTAWLYSQFATGTLPGYNYTYDTPGSQTGARYIDAGELQNAIWWLQGEGGVAYDAGNAFMNAVVTNFASAAGAQAAASGNAFGVAVLNLSSIDPTTGNIIYNQDQLIYGVPDGGTTIALLGVGLLGIALFRKRAANAA